MMTTSKIKTLIAKTLVIMIVTIICLIALFLVGSFVYLLIKSGGWFIPPIVVIVIFLWFSGEWAFKYLENQKGRRAKLVRPKCKPRPKNQEFDDDLGRKI